MPAARSVIAAAVLSLAGAVGGCSGDPSDEVGRQPPSSTSSPTPSESPSESPAVTPRRPEVTTVLRRRIDAQVASHVQVSPQFVVLSRTTVADGNQDEVVALDRATGELRSVFASRFPDGKIDWVEVEGRWAVFADEDRVPSTMDPSTVWVLWAVDLVSGRQIRLDDSGGERAYVPIPRASGNGAFFWSTPNPDEPRRAVVARWRPGDADGARVFRTDGEDEGVAHAWRRTAMVLRRSDAGAGVDVAMVRRSGEAEYLTDSHAVLDFDVQGDRLAWTEESLASPSSDPASVWSMDLRDERPVRVFDGFSYGNPAAGDDFTAWISSSLQPSVSTGPDEVVTLRTAPLHIEARMDAAGDELAFVVERGGSLVVNVVRVSSP